MNLGLKDKNVVIMGGTSGIGLRTAEMFIEEGANVAVCGRDQERMNDAYKHLQKMNVENKIYAETCDVTKEEDVFVFVENSVRQFGNINILVNVAGRSIMGNFFNINNDQWMEQIQLKYFSIIYAIRAVRNYMVSAGGGRIININATLAKEPEPHMVATAATRAGLLNLSKTLSHELAADNILVNSVSLGLIRTEQWERRRKQNAPEVDPEKWYEDLAYKRNIPLKRVGEVEEVASVIVFLGSERSSYVSGSTIEVAGGLGKSL